MKLHVLTSWSKPAKLALSAFVIVVGGLVLPLTGMFTSTASAAMNAKECYEKYNNKSTASFSSYPNPSNAYDTSCTTQQFCSIETVTSMAGGFETKQDFYRCKSPEEVQKEQDEKDNQTIRNAEAAPVAEAICAHIGDASSGNMQTMERVSECGDKVRAQYGVCRDSQPVRNANSDEDIVKAISDCMRSWASTNYPSADLDNLQEAVVEGRKAGVDTAGDIGRLKNDEKMEVCAAKGLTYDPDNDGADADGCVTAVGSNTCTGGALGWIMCPLTGVFQSLIEKVGEYIDNMMAMEPLMGTDSGARIQEVWRIFVGFANLALVVAFLIVIFSQATSVGLSAYGIKKMLPRIIAAAILINLSYFICAIAVDITNIIAASVQGIVSNIAANIPASAVDQDKWDVGQAIGANLGLLAGAVLGGYVLVTGFVAFVLPAAIAAGLAIITVFFGIALRQVLIYMLIFVAPLAFAAMILPNTEPLFTKWRKLFVNMLLLYPVIMFMLYGSGLVAALILASKGGSENTPIDIIAFVVATIGPFMGMYMYLKNSNKLMSMAAGAISKLGSGVQGLGNDWAKQKQKDMSNKQMARMQNSNNRLVQFGSKFDPRVMKLKRDEMSRQYEETAKLAGARTTSKYVVKKYGADSMQGARAEAVLDELDMKEAKIKLDFVFKGDAQAAIKAALKSGDQSLMNLSAGKLVDTAKLDEVQKHMSNPLTSGEHAQSMARYIQNNHFAKMKEQDLGMMYAVNDMIKSPGDAKASIDTLMKGGSQYDKDAVRSSNAAVATQENYALQRQAVVMSKEKAEAVIDDTNVRSTIKGKQLNTLETIAGRPRTPI